MDAAAVGICVRYVERRLWPFKIKSRTRLLSNMLCRRLLLLTAAAVAIFMLSPLTRSIVTTAARKGFIGMFTPPPDMGAK